MEFIFVYDYISIMRFGLRSLVVVLAAAVGPALSCSGATAAELVVFDQPGCVWCQRFEAEVSEAYANSEEGRRAPLRRVDIRAQDKAGFALARSVRITPTFVLVDDEREVGRLTGYPGRDFFWSEVAALTERLFTAPAKTD